MEEQNKKSNGHGGARKGAGRKKVEDRECHIGFGVSRKAKANLEAFAAQRGLSQREAVNLILERLEVDG